MSGDPPRVIFDCNIFFQGFFTPGGPAFACLMCIQEKRAKLLLSVELLAEARDVLCRPFVREKFPQIKDSHVDLFLSNLAYTAELWRVVPPVFTCDRDPGDEPYLNLAIAATADYLVSRDNDLLALATDHSIEAKRIRQLTGNRLQIVTPVAFLEKVSRTSAG